MEEVNAGNERGREEREWGERDGEKERGARQREAAEEGERGRARAAEATDRNKLQEQILGTSSGYRSRLRGERGSRSKPVPFSVPFGVPFGVPVGRSCLVVPVARSCRSFLSLVPVGRSCRSFLSIVPVGRSCRSLPPSLPSTSLPRCPSSPHGIHLRPPLEPSKRPPAKQLGSTNRVRLYFGGDALHYRTRTDSLRRFGTHGST